MTIEEDKPKISELKGHVYGMTEIGKQADQYTKTTKAIGEYVGRMYGHDMKKLVLQLEETRPEEPEYPVDQSDKNKAIWSKKYDLYLKKEERYEDQKGKVFTIIMGQCNKPMKNRVEGASDYDDAEKKRDVLVLLRLIKDIAFDSDEKKYPPMQAAQAWRNLMKVWQQEDEDLVDYYKRFKSMVEMVERAYGAISPEAIAERTLGYARNKSGTIKEVRGKFLTHIFMDGANKKAFRFLMRDLHNNYALGNDNYPDTVEDALQVLTLYGERSNKIEKKKGKNDDDKSTDASFAQQDGKTVVCWRCGKEGHVKKNCPELKNNETSNAQVDWSG